MVVYEGRDVAARLADDHKGVDQIDTLGGRQYLRLLEALGGESTRLFRVNP